MPETGFLAENENTIEKMFWGRAEVASAASIYYFSKGSNVQKLIHQVKYKKQKELGIFLGELMGVAMLKNEEWKNFDYILPVPLHPKKEKLRGYNQSLLLAEGIAKHINAQVLSNNLIRNIFTETQTKKTRLERWKNTTDIFNLQSPEKLYNKNILLVDDIITTGSTLEACANVLNSKAKCMVSIVTFAYAK
jgi:ComF family protein